MLVFAERRELPASALLDLLQGQYGAAEIVLSAVSVIELEHGIYRA